MLLAVVCDLGPLHGVGHLMRCVALAEEFGHRGYDVTFVADAASVPFAAAQLDRRGFRAVPPPPTLEEYDALLAGLAPDVVVVDSYHLPAAVYAAVSSRWPTVAIVDGDPAGRPAHLYVDQNLGAEEDHWDLPAGAVRLAGLDYALQRDEIAGQRPAAPKDTEHDPLRVFAFFGGTDAFGAGPLLTESLWRTGLPLDLTVVTPRWWDLPEPPPTQPTRLIRPTDQLASYVLDADVVVSAAGTSSWELLCLRAACGLVAVADNQRVSYERVVATGAVVGVGHLDRIEQDPGEAVAALTRLLGDAALRRMLRERAGELVDGLGRRRVADAAERLG